MEVSETTAESDTIELTSNEFENDLLGAAVPAVKENASEGWCFINASGENVARRENV